MINFDVFNNQLYFSFEGSSSEEFQLIYDLCREFYMKYDRKFFMWTNTPANMLAFLNIYKERIDSSLEFEQYLPYLVPPYKTQFMRYKVLEKLIVKPPFGEHQKEGIKQGVTQSNFLMWWGPGSGKTYTMITILNHLIYYGETEKILVLCPSQGLYNWIKEFNDFSFYKFNKEDFYIASVNAREPFQEHHKVVLMTTDMFRLLSDNRYRDKLKEKNKKRKVKKKVPRSGFKYRTPQFDLKEWGDKITLIIDESHYIKNRKSGRLRVLNLYRDFFKHVYMLSGTPHPKGLQEAYSQIRYVEPDLLPTYQLWISTIAEIDSDAYDPYAIAYIKPEEASKFVDKTSFLVDRRTTEECITLPEHYIRPIRIHMSEKHTKLYQMFTNYVITKTIEEDGMITPVKLHNKFSYISQLVHDPCLMEGKIEKNLNPQFATALAAWKFEDNSRLEVCDDLVTEVIKEGGRKLTLFASHPDTVDRLAKRYKKYNPIVLHGQIPIPKGEDLVKFRFDQIEKFKNEDECHMLIANPAVMSEAINITQCIDVIYFCRDWSVTTWLQSYRRFVRGGQTKHVNIYLLLMVNSLDITQCYEMEMSEEQLNKVYKKNTLTKEEWKALFTGKKYEDIYT